MSARWNERQQAMLRTFGVRLFAPMPVVPPSAPVESLEGTVGSKEASRTPPPGPAVQRPQPPVPPRAPSERRVDEAPLSTPSGATWAVPANLAALDADALRQAMLACTACALSASRRQVVVDAGVVGSPLMIVGEAPGEQEDRQGEPFVGRSGQLLDRMLETIGLARRPPAGSGLGAVHIVNTLKCRPPDNRNPQPQELAACAGWLARQIDLGRPRVLLAVGRFAAASLLGRDEAIGRLRGRLHRHASGVPVVVTYHPSYLLRQPLDKARAWDDFCLVRDAIDGRVRLPGGEADAG